MALLLEDQHMKQAGWFLCLCAADTDKWRDQVGRIAILLDRALGTVRDVLHPVQALSEISELVLTAPHNLTVGAGLSYEAMYYTAIGDRESAAISALASNQLLVEGGWGILTALTLGRAKTAKGAVGSLDNLGTVGRHADDLIGPTIGRSGFRTTREFASAVEVVYQKAVNDAYIAALELKKLGLLKGNRNTAVGNYVDRGGSLEVKAFLRNEGITEGPTGIIRMNRWLRDPTAGSRLYTRPDIHIPGAGRIFDATVGFKPSSSTQIKRFNLFSGGDLITLIRPATLATGGSYSVIPRAIGPQ